MLESVNPIKTIDAPPDAAFAVVAAIGGLDRLLPLIESCRVEGAGVGARRFLRLAASAGGGEIEDRIDEIDHQLRRFRYTRLRSPFPVRSYVGTVEVRPAPEGRSEVSWRVDIDVAPEAKDELVPLLYGALSGLIDGIEREAKQQETASR
jgi:hypothetical protein